MRRRGGCRDLLTDLRFGYNSVQLILQTISLFEPNLSFVRDGDFCRKGFFVVSLQSCVFLFIPEINGNQFCRLFFQLFFQSYQLQADMLECGIDGSDPRRQVLMLILKCCYVTTGTKPLITSGERDLLNVCHNGER